MKEIKHRTSIRNFTNEAVEQEKIENILRAAMQAPSAGNQQPWEFYVVTDKGKIKELSETSPYAGCAANASVVIAIVYKDDIIFPDYAQIDCSIAVENMLLEIDHLGLGSVMLGIAPLKERMDAVGKVLNLPENLHAFTLLPVGYPGEVKEQEDRYDANRVHYL
ncbi:MAG: nitroreductase family protein [Clostridiaceae bacterium]|nr:nitroreductase family protein [Clostridiaceae bacterium]